MTLRVSRGSGIVRIMSESAYDGGTSALPPPKQARTMLARGRLPSRQVVSEMALVHVACKSSVLICQAVRAMLRFKRGMRGWSGAPASDPAACKVILPCACKPWCLTRFMPPSQVSLYYLSVYLAVRLSMYFFVGFRFSRTGGGEPAIDHTLRGFQDISFVHFLWSRVCLCVRIPFPTPDASPPNAEGAASGHS